jgi:outer membrane protein TolC
MNKLKCALIILLALFTHNTFAQEVYSLKEVIEIAKSQSPAYKRAETRKEFGYWQYQVYKSNFNPQLALFGRIPDFSNSVESITQPDGSELFNQVNQSTSNLSLGLQQQIGFTGATISMNTSVRRFDNFTSDTTFYSGSPINISLTQPLFRFNSLKWDKRIEPLRFEESKRDYVQELEEVAQTASTLFFNLLSAQVSLEIAKKNLGNNDTIYKIAQGRYELGKIPENELLQLELNLMNSRQDIAQANLNLETGLLRLRSYLGIKTGKKFDLIIPKDIPQFLVDADIALSEALANRQEAIGFKRRLLEAERELDRAKSQSGLNVDIEGSFGRNNRANDYLDIYRNTDELQTISVGFSLPILDWGRRKSAIGTQQANLQLVEYTLEQERVDFEQEVFTQVRTLEMLRDRVRITEKADDISQRRYDIAKNRYLIGKISITDLSLALTEKDQAKRDYINSLGNFWQAYYNLRQLTLYDFERNERLIK